jgi:hypothetical protein
MDRREIGIDGANLVWLAEDRVQWWAFVDMVMNRQIPEESRLFFDKLSDVELFKEYPAAWSKYI